MIKACIKDVFVFGSKFPEGQLTYWVSSHPRRSNSRTFVGPIHYPVPQESMCSDDYPARRFLQKGIISYPGHQHSPAIRATGNSSPAGEHLPRTSQFLHQFAVFPNIPRQADCIGSGQSLPERRKFVSGEILWKNCRSTLVVRTKAGLSATSACRSTGLPSRASHMKRIY